MSVRILIGDMLERLDELDDCSIDSAVTDPPYHLTSIVKRFGATNAAPAKAGKTGAYARASKGFMGQTWDGGDIAFRTETWVKVLRVLKPGSHLIAFSGTRTYHRMVCAIEDAGFEVRDQIAWLYGSGFPKSHNLDGEHEGWGTALKPAFEPIVVARKPLVGTVASNMAEHRVGALNIDACRNGETGTRNNGRKVDSDIYFKLGTFERVEYNKGRWPANVIHDGSDEVVGAFPETTSGVLRAGTIRNVSNKFYGAGMAAAGKVASEYDTGGDSGSAARFFYSAKTDSTERHMGCADLPKGNNHPTVKPIDLMRYLCRLVTPPGGTVLDPFAGSGSTLIAADAEQFNAIGVEMDLGYVEIAKARLSHSAGLFAEISVEPVTEQAA